MFCTAKNLTLYPTLTPSPAPPFFFFGFFFLHFRITHFENVSHFPSFSSPAEHLHTFVSPLLSPSFSFYCSKCFLLTYVPDPHGTNPLTYVGDLSITNYHNSSGSGELSPTALNPAPLVSGH